jgi:predicted MFS family arabinose efflux permease
MSGVPASERARNDRSPRIGLLVLALAVFAAITTETLPVGLLPLISRELEVSESTTGLLVSLYAAMVILLSVPITLLTRRVPGKVMLLASVASYALSNLFSALAPSFELLAAARALGGITHAVFFSVAIGYASRLVPAEKTGRALALMSGGVSAGLILGSPLATALAGAVGWRLAFGSLVLLMVVVLVLLAVLLPSTTVPRDVQTSASRGRRRDAAAVITANTLAYLGQFTLYTYVTVLLLRSAAPPVAIAPLLFLFGLFGLVGIWRAAPLLDHNLRRAAVVILTVVLLGVLGVGAAIPHLALVVVAGVVWNTAFGPAASLFQSATVRTNAISPELSGAWINMTANIGIGGGALLGSVVLDVSDVRSLAWVSAVPLALALLVAAVSRRAFSSAPDVDDDGPARHPASSQAAEPS